MYETKSKQFPHSQCGNYVRGFSLTHFWQKFRESNGFTKQITKELIWRKISLVTLVRENICNFHSVVSELRAPVSVPKASHFTEFLQVNCDSQCWNHSVEFTKIYSYVVLAKLSWKQHLTEKNLVRVKFSFFPS